MHGVHVMGGQRPRPCSFHKPYANFCHWQSIVVERSHCDCERATVLYRSQTKMATEKGHDPSCTCKNGDFGAATGGNIFITVCHCYNFDFL